MYVDHRGNQRIRNIFIIITSDSDGVLLRLFLWLNLRLCLLGPTFVMLLSILQFNTYSLAARWFVVASSPAPYFMRTPNTHHPHCQFCSNIDRLQNKSCSKIEDTTKYAYTLDHAVLLKRLQLTFRISGTVLDWYASYWCTREQSVITEGTVPCLLPVLRGMECRRGQSLD